MGGTTTAVDGEDADTSIVGVSDARCRGGSDVGEAADAVIVVAEATLVVVFIDSALIEDVSGDIVVSSREAEEVTGGI